MPPPGWLTPYRVDNRLLLDVQRVIPLPEADQLTVQLRRREIAARAASGSGQDWTPYVITFPGGRTPQLRKRRAVLAMVRQLHTAGVTAERIAEVLPRSKFLSFDGILTGEQLAAAVADRYPHAPTRHHRWFLDEPIHDGDHTWVLSNQWGSATVGALDALLSIAPQPGFGYEPA